jgi:hypothetical protein
MHSEETQPPEKPDDDDAIEAIAPIKPANPAGEIETEIPRVGSRDAPGG